MLGLITRAAVTGVVAYTVVKVLEKSGAAEKLTAFVDEKLSQFDQGQKDRLIDEFAKARVATEELLNNIKNGVSK